MIDIRYHVTSLMAVFIALAIGIMIGSSVAPGTATKLTEAVKKQNEKVDSVLAEYERDHAVLGRLEEALSALTPALERGKLAGKRVAIIQTGDQPDASKAAADAISAAGGTVSSTTIVTNDFEQLGDDDYQRIREEMPAEPTTSDPTSDLLRPLAMALRQGAPDGDQRDASLGVLRRENLIETSGDYTLPVTMIVMVGGTGANTDMTPEPLATRETELISLLTSASHVIVVGCEAQAVTNSSLTSYRNAGVATVDCVDRAVGKLDLIYALLGDKADYGVRATADRVLPLEVESGLETSGVSDADTSAPHVRGVPSDR